MSYTQRLLATYGAAPEPLRPPTLGGDVVQTRVGSIEDVTDAVVRCDAMCFQPAEFYVVSAVPPPEDMDPLVHAVCGGCLVGVVRATFSGGA